MALSTASARLGSRSVLSMAGPGLYLFPQLLHASTSSAPTAAGLLPTFPILAPVGFAKIPPFLRVGARRVGDFSKRFSLPYNAGSKGKVRGSYSSHVDVRGPRTIIAPHIVLKCSPVIPFL